MHFTAWLSFKNLAKTWFILPWETLSLSWIWALKGGVSFCRHLPFTHLPTLIWVIASASSNAFHWLFFKNWAKTGLFFHEEVCSFPESGLWKEGLVFVRIYLSPTSPLLSGSLLQHHQIYFAQPIYLLYIHIFFTARSGHFYFYHETTQGVGTSYFGKIQNIDTSHNICNSILKSLADNFWSTHILTYCMLFWGKYNLESFISTWRLFHSSNISDLWYTWQKIEWTF